MQADVQQNARRCHSHLRWHDYCDHCSGSQDQQCWGYFGLCNCAVFGPDLVCLIVHPVCTKRSQEMLHIHGMMTPDKSPPGTCIRFVGLCIGRTIVSGAPAAVLPCAAPRPRRAAPLYSICPRAQNTELKIYYTKQFTVPLPWLAALAVLACTMAGGAQTAPLHPPSSGPLPTAVYTPPPPRQTPACPAPP